jgi:hypothetical protein
VICWIALALGMTLLWPPDALADLANDFCCWATAATLQVPGASVQTETTCAAPFCSLLVRVTQPPQAATLVGSCPRAMQRLTASAIRPSAPDDRAALLIPGWQFRRRAAAAPRAPSACA